MKLMSALTYFSIVLLFVLANAAYAQDNWRKQMQDVSRALGETLPLLYPSSDKNVKELTEKVSKLHDLTEQLEVESAHVVANGDYDPALTYFANSFKDDVDRAYLSLKEGHSEFAKQSLRNTTTNCIGCHSRSERGKSFDLTHTFSEHLKKAPWIDRTRFLAAGRQFDVAYGEVIKELKKPASPFISSLDLERGARIALVIAIRVNQDPDQALKLIDALMLSKNVSPFTKQDAGKWKADIENWKREKKKKYTSPGEIIAFSTKLIRESKPQSRSDVNLLRASALLHNFVRSHSAGYERAEAYYLLGEAYNGLIDQDLGSLQEMYYKACIHDRPHSDLSIKCYKSLEEANILGYSGTTGLRLPPNIKLRLRHLKEKASKLQ